MSDCLIDKRSDGVALITLNRPESLNAMGGNLMELLGEYLHSCEQDNEVRCVALTGAGRGFCAGGDVKQQSLRSEAREDAEPAVPQAVPSAEKGRSRSHPLQDSHMRTSHKLHTMAKPTVALVNGPAAGAGMSLALACDMHFCSDQASFHTAFAKVGLSGDYGGTYYLQRLIGYGRAIELYYSAERVDAETALQLGIANHVAPHDQFMHKGLEFCTRLASGPTRAYANIKANFNFAERSVLEDLLDQEAHNIGVSSTTKDHREGALSFVQRRKPNFTGE
ncbi:MAG: enoyl-CoA hydratase [Pseudomonadales bacterium]|jgi:2-(1,2-epoxy-1,2-dihydrophenyl)acetyl-CoA isomerase|nr:enoyl-CoA hydratase [Pseudomonadales bacterium]MDP7360238.1 enoyl-CoA hydratase [Pseudomonadales bacterium]HJN53356.1 enoyl-CoA hydratase [Pseudomonadales bacterium]